MDWSAINLPPLSERYTAALRVAIEYVFTEFEPFAVIATGSILRGNPDPSSDFDIVVLHNHTWRRRVQRLCEGVPAEIFVNSPAWMDRYFAEEESAGRPIMAHMVTSGVVAYSASSTTAEVIAKAQASLGQGPNFSEFGLLQQRYSAACLFEDALETASRDEGTAALILGRAVDAAVSYWFASRQRFSVRAKEQLHVIRAEDAETANLVCQALLAEDLTERIAAGRRLAQSVIGHAGFFEWDSGPGEP
jgi:hypothetical protein